jgi:hypothetical protein
MGPGLAASPSSLPMCTALGFDLAGAGFDDYRELDPRWKEWS